MFVCARVELHVRLCERVVTVHVIACGIVSADAVAGVCLGEVSTCQIMRVCSHPSNRRPMNRVKIAEYEKDERNTPQGRVEKQRVLGDKVKRLPNNCFDEPNDERRAESSVEHLSSATIFSV